MISIFLLAWWCSVKEIQLTPLATMAAPGEDLFLEKPSDVVVSPDGRVFVPDAAGRVVFYWDLNGAYLGHIGRAGAGPGEFSFLGVAGPEAKVGIANESLYVFDGVFRRVSQFSLKTLKLVRTVKLRGPAGKVQMFKVNQNGEFILGMMNFMSQKPERVVVLFDPEGEMIRTLYTTPDRSYRRDLENGQTVGITIFGYGSTMVSAYNDQIDQVYVGLSDRTELSVLQSDGSLVRTIDLGLTTRDVTDEEKEEFKNLPFLKGNGLYRVEFPKERCLFDNILPLSPEKTLVYSRSALNAHISGFVMDKAGTPISKFNYDAGEGGNLYCSLGRLMAITSSVDGEWVIKELSIAH